MKAFIKPAHLQVGDTVAIVSSSWGGPSMFPHIYEAGIKHLQEDFGLKIKEYPTARMAADMLYSDPKIRAKDINDAFSDKEVKAIISTIGGDDSVRILPYLDKEIIRNNPKIVMGYSDTSTLLTYCNQLGLVTFNGPAIMAGFSQIKSLPKEFVSHVKSILFENPSVYNYLPYIGNYCEGYPDWSKLDNVGLVKNEHPQESWHWLQGNSTVQGHLFGGCLEVLEFFLKGTAYWPTADFWREKIVFLETSEEKPTISTVKYALRGLGMQGVLDVASGLIFGRARDYTLEEKEKLDKAIITIVAKEFGHPELPIITNMDFGHTDPQWILPLGIRAEINCSKKTFGLVESPCA